LQAQNNLSGTKLCSFWELLDEKVAKVSSIIGKLVNMKTEHDLKNAFSPDEVLLFSDTPWDTYLIFYIAVPLHT
jgi:hypothetical protein